MRPAAAPIYGTMFYAAPHFHHCPIDGRVVALDLRTTRYFLVRGASGTALVQWQDGMRRQLADDAFDDLIAHGYVLREPTGNRDLAACDAISPTSRFETGPTCAKRADLAFLSWLLGSTRLRIATGSLARGLRPLQKRAGQMRVQDREELAKRMGRFVAARPAIPLSRSCLLDSVALYLFLRDSRVELVFGVSIEPFAAHCWLERDNFLLNDELDHVRHFTPILRYRA